MLNRAWRIILLIVALIAMIWPYLLGASTWWIALVAVAILLISEVLNSGAHAMYASAHIAHKKRRK